MTLPVPTVYGCDWCIDCGVVNGLNSQSKVLSAPAELPDIFMLNSIRWMFPDSPFPAGSNGIVSAYLDPGAAFTNSCVPPYPASQNGNPNILCLLGDPPVIGQGQPLVIPEKKFDPPYIFQKSRGDKLLVDLPFGGVGSLAIWLWIHVSALEPIPALVGNTSIGTGGTTNTPGTGTVFSATLTQVNSGSYGQTKRQAIPLSALTLPPNAVSQVQITFAAGPNGWSISDAYVGQEAASGSAWDFDTTPVPLLVNGSASFTVPPNGTIVATASYAWPKTGGLVVSMFANSSTAADAMGLSGVANVTHAYKPGGDDAATVATTGYTQLANLISGISQVVTDGF